MDRRLRAKEKIEHAFAFVVARIKLANKLNFTDVNIVAEDFFKFLFNIVYDYDLKNANAIKQNETAIDLYYNNERVAYQITSQNKPTKINSAVDAFIKAEKHKGYSKFIIFSITADNKCSSTALEKLNEFNVQGTHINVSDLQREILTGFETNKLELIAEYLEYETTPSLKRKPVIDSKASEKLKSLHIVEQMYQVLKSFDGFNCIYPRTLAKIFPFNVKEKIYDAYSHYCLKTNNKAIHELLQKVKVDENHNLVISDISLKPYEEKLKEIFIILNHSLVECICYREKYTEIEHHKINIDTFNPDCQCNFCQYHKFNIKPLFAALKEKSIQHSENLFDALNEGFYLCKLGEHVKGWQVFDSVASKSKEQNKSIIHYLALLNIVRIRGYVDSPWWENEQKQILPKIDEIDLHDTLCSFSLPIDVRDELIRVKEEYHLHYSQEEIDEHAVRIAEIKKLYSDSGYSSGTPAVNLLWEELHLLHTYYVSNSIIFDDFSAFRATMSKGVEALLISHSTDNRYEYKYKQFDNFILSLMIFYIEEEALAKMFKRNEIESLPVLKRDKKAFLYMMEHFFTFQFTRGTMNYIKFNEDIAKQEYFSHYRQALRHFFNRVVLILSKVNLSDEELKPLAKPFIDFMQAAKDFNHTNWEYAIKFFKQRVQIFDEKQIKIIIELTLDEKQHRSGDDVLQNICDYAAEKASITITDQAFFQRVLNSVSAPCKSCKRIHDMKQILAFWNVADENGKQLITQKSIEYLENIFDPDFYQLAVFLDVFNKDENINLLDQYIAYAESTSHAFDVKEENGHWIVQSYSAFNCINCLAYMKVDFKKESFQAISKKSEYYNWLINYETYDYTNFNTKWLVQLCPYQIKIKLHSVKALKEKVAEELKKEYDSHLAEFFVKYLN